jgi:adenosylhomocysteine nucleosidase
MHIKKPENWSMQSIVIVALESEFPPIQRNDFRVIYSGVGKINAARTTTEAILRFQPNRIINVGSVGVLDVKRLGTVMQVNQVIERDMNAMPLSPRGQVPFDKSPHRFFSVTPGLTCATGDSFVTKRDHWLISNNVDMVDMELFAIAKISSHYRIPWISLKFGTDLADGNASENWSGNLINAQSALFEALSQLS